MQGRVFQNSPSEQRFPLWRVEHVDFSIYIVIGYTRSGDSFPEAIAVMTSLGNTLSWEKFRERKQPNKSITKRQTL